MPFLRLKAIINSSVGITNSYDTIFKFIEVEGARIYLTGTSI